MSRVQNVLLRIGGNVPFASVNRIAPGHMARLAAYVALLGIIYYQAALIGLGFRFQNSQIGVVWPANAVLVSALLLAPRSRWWLVLATTSIAHAAVMFEAVPAWRWAWQIAANSALTMTTVEMLRRYAGLPLHLESRRQVTAYCVIAFAVPAVFSFVTPGYFLSLFGLEPYYSPAAAMLRVTLSNGPGIMLLTPAIVLWAHYGWRRAKRVPVRRQLEAALMMISLLAVGAVAFGAGPETARMPGLLLWIVPSLLWAAVRFGPLGAATALLCVAALSLWGTASQQGPFVLALSVENVTSLQLFWIVLGAPVLLLAASIREREQVEAALHEQRNQLAHITRVATVGELSGALAHELRQPLTAILANAQAGIHMLSAQKVDLNELREILKDISEQDMHAASVISHLRSLLREGESQFEEISIETIVRDALALGRNTIATSGVNVQAQIAGGLPRVHGDPVQLLQVMLNLIVNGCEATVSKPTAERQLWLQVTRPDQKHVEVRITDSGVGLPVGREERVFEPFFTTKDKGLGLGLSIGRSIVRAHGGRLWGENSAQGGATFYLLLPADEVHSAPAPG